MQSRFKYRRNRVASQCTPLALGQPAVQRMYCKKTTHLRWGGVDIGKPCRINVALQAVSIHQFAETLLASGCAHQTTFTSTPPGAEVVATVALEIGLVASCLQRLEVLFQAVDDDLDVLDDALGRKPLGEARQRGGATHRSETSRGSGGGAGLLGQRGYYDALMTFMHQVVREGFLAPPQLDLVQVGSEVAPLLSQLVQAAGLNAPDHPERL